MEVPKDVDVKRLIADFGIAANAIAVVVNVEPSRTLLVEVRSCWFAFMCKNII
jgi:hypothetical protein